ncbi:hypothetical protein JSY36_05080 [Bacillus sp. H-16]|uniref:hypothetical protein n=1 Tax=Alteribacter salitolerans TaxID=2912333 RepID=UPI001963EBCF|nr:hypothetical protein [Alteribacter salitolerans]MBM7095126.1 hypothetical protein [Alteribacter salitolerans]
MKRFVLFAVIAMAVALGGCSGGESSAAESIESRIKEGLGISPYIPEHPVYPLGTAVMKYDFKVEDGEAVKGDPVKVELYYMISQDQVLDNISREHLEENNRMEIIYGEAYLDREAANVTIYKGSVGTIQESEAIEIEGHEVQYLFLEQEDGRDTEVVIMATEFDDFGYTIQYLLIDDETEEEAKVFAAEIIRNVGKES